ncbi:MAG: hypothetical protein ACD_64C00264G0013 [uncultured bacterium]|nr:MAG: hypothetical protein ACD_64C00264G0013 [uncultured bacterium]HLE76241.1 DUF4381 family protein [Candidatus Babeliales bacterium]
MNNQIELYDIYSTWHVPFWQTKWFYWTTIGFILALCIAALFSFYQWYRKKQKRTTTPWDAALTIITQLQNKQYATQQDGKQCYYTLTSVIKTYLQNRFSFPVAHKTDEQVARYLDTIELDMKIKRNVQSILRGCLLIKFANEQAVNEQIQEHLKLAQELVITTIPQKPDQTKSAPTS